MTILTAVGKFATAGKLSLVVAMGGIYVYVAAVFLFNLRVTSAEILVVVTVFGWLALRKLFAAVRLTVQAFGT